MAQAQQHADVYPERESRPSFAGSDASFRSAGPPSAPVQKEEEESWWTSVLSLFAPCLPCLAIGNAKPDPYEELGYGVRDTHLLNAIKMFESGSKWTGKMEISGWNDGNYTLIIGKHVGFVSSPSGGPVFRIKAQHKFWGFAAAVEMELSVAAGATPRVKFVFWDKNTVFEGFIEESKPAVLAGENYLKPGSQLGAAGAAAVKRSPFVLARKLD
eukprot:tig00000073_g1691.t1